MDAKELMLGNFVYLPATNQECKLKTNLEKALWNYKSQCEIHGLELSEDAYIFKMIKLAAEPNWINVKDELPEINKPVLCQRLQTSMGGTKIITPCISYVNKRGVFNCKMDWGHVSHWQELPVNAPLK